VPTEFLMHATVRIDCITSKGESIGTGFFFNLFVHGDQVVPVIVSNKHVVKGAITGSIELTPTKVDGSPDLANHFPIRISEFEQGWIGHPDPDVDLTIFPCANILESLAKEGRKVFWAGLDQSLVPTDEEMQALTPVEELLVVGYPIGVWDTKNNSPVFRRGVTATAPYLDFSGRREFLIDAAIFPGSSGSPVMLFNQGVWVPRSGGTSIGGRIRLLGVNYAVINYNSSGEIKIEQTPTDMRAVPILPIPSNLGVCIKSSRILDFEPVLVEKGFKPPDGYIMRARKPAPG
jgi:Trypsin-like peptidase domain